MADIKKLPGQFIDFSIAVAIAGPAIGIIQDSPLPAPFKTGASSLVGLGLVKGGLKFL